MAEPMMISKFEPDPEYHAGGSYTAPAAAAASLGGGLSCLYSALSATGSHAGMWPPCAHVRLWSTMDRMNVRARSVRAGSFPRAGTTRVWESAWTAYLSPPQTFGNSVIPNGIFAVWNVEISHSPCM